MKPANLLVLAIVAPLCACTANARMDLSSYQGLPPGAPARPTSVPEPPAEQPAYSTPPSSQSSASQSSAPQSFGSQASGSHASVAPSAQQPPAPPQVMAWEAKRTAQTGPEAASDVYIVRQGDTLYQIAQRHGVTLAMLYSSNGLLNERLTPGQHIIIPKRASAR